MKVFLSEQENISTFGEEHRTASLYAPCWLFARVHLNNASQLSYSAVMLVAPSLARTVRVTLLPNGSTGSDEVTPSVHFLWSLFQMNMSSKHHGFVKNSNRCVGLVKSQNNGLQCDTNRKVAANTNRQRLLQPRRQTSTCPLFTALY